MLLIARWSGGDRSCADDVVAPTGIHHHSQEKNMMDTLVADQLVSEILGLLRQSKQSVVLAESCTAGLIAATLAGTSGMSECLSGSFVTYQTVSKSVWLGVEQTLIESCDVVSQEVAEAMVSGALERTPHANVAVAITGHLGPGAPPHLDGVAWLCIGIRGEKNRSLRLSLMRDPELSGAELRKKRQVQAAMESLELLRDRLKEHV